MLKLFLNDDLEEEIYMESPKGYVVPSQRYKFVNWLNPCMAWNKHLNDDMKILLCDSIT